MTAIAGLISTRGDVEAAQVLAMLDSMGKRGLDSRRIAGSGTAVFGQGQLPGRPSPADPRAEPPMMVCADLRLEWPEFAGGPDTGKHDIDQILDLYRQLGEGVAAQLSGDFAFAIWDPALERLYFARDGLGVKPFHYSEEHGRFAFASEVKAILTLPWITRRIPSVRIAEFLSEHVPPEDETFFLDVRRLPPGCWGTYDRIQGTSIVRYCAPYLPDLVTIEDPAPEFRRRLQDAVSQRLPSDGNFVSMLSGGLDSSSVTSLARLATIDWEYPVRTISMVFPQSAEGDERPFIDAILDSGHYDPQFVSIDEFDPFADFRRTLEIHDGPCLAPGLTRSRHLYQRLPAGSVLLSGHGGDEVVSKGSGHLHDLATASKWWQVWIALAGVADIYGQSRTHMFVTLLSRYGPGRHKRRSLARAVGLGGRRNESAFSYLNPDFAARYADQLAVRKPRLPGERAGRAFDLDKVIGPAQTYALEVLDRESAAAGVESRFPFVDRDLIRFSHSLPASTKLKDGWTRFVLRDAMEGVLPETVRWRRTKFDFSSMLVRGMLLSPASQPERFKRRGAEMSRFVDLEAVERARGRLLAAPAGVMGQDGYALWRTTALSEWLEHMEQHDMSIV